MKKLLVALAFVLPMFVGVGASSADPTCTPVGCVTVNEGGYIVAVDGDAGNPDPIDGYVSVSSGGQICADDNGAPGNSSSPTCGP